MEMDEIIQKLLSLGWHYVPAKCHEHSGLKDVFAYSYDGRYMLSAYVRSDGSIRSDVCGVGPVDTNDWHRWRQWELPLAEAVRNYFECEVGIPPALDLEDEE